MGLQSLRVKYEPPLLLGMDFYDMQRLIERAERHIVYPAWVRAASITISESDSPSHVQLIVDLVIIAPPDGPVAGYERELDQAIKDAFDKQKDAWLIRHGYEPNACS